MHRHPGESPTEAFEIPLGQALAGQLADALAGDRPTKIILIDKSKPPATWWSEGSRAAAGVVYQTALSHGLTQEQAQQSAEAGLSIGIVRAIALACEANPTDAEIRTLVEMASLLPVPDHHIPTVLETYYDALHQSAQQKPTKDNPKLAAHSAVFAALCQHGLTHDGQPVERSLGGNETVFTKKIDMLSRDRATAAKLFGSVFGVFPPKESPRGHHTSSVAVLGTAVAVGATLATPQPARGQNAIELRVVGFTQSGNLVTYPTSGSPSLKSVVTQNPGAFVVPKLAQAFEVGEPVKPSIPGNAETLVQNGEDPIAEMGGKDAADAEHRNSNADKPPMAASNNPLAKVVENTITSLQSKPSSVGSLLTQPLQDALGNPANLKSWYIKDAASETPIFPGDRLGFDHRLVADEMSKVIKEYGTDEYLFIGASDKGEGHEYWYGLTAEQSIVLSSLLAQSRLSLLTDAEIKERLTTLSPDTPPEPADPTPRPSQSQAPKKNKTPESSKIGTYSEAYKKAFHARIRNLAKQSPFNPMDPDELADILLNADQKPHDPLLTLEVVSAELFQESGFDPNICSAANACGIAQLIPGTAASNGVENRKDPRQAVKGYYTYMGKLIDIARKRFPNAPDEDILRAALGFYNAGPEWRKNKNITPQQANDFLPPYNETQNYVKKIFVFKNNSQLFIDSYTSAIPKNGTDCAPGSESLGMSDPALEGGEVLLAAFELCALDGLKSYGQESTPGNTFYIEGAKNRAIVAAKVSGEFVQLLNDALEKGVVFETALSSYRTPEHQAQLAAAQPDRRAVAAQYGSQHVKGSAVDFNILSASYSACRQQVNQDPAGNCIAPNDPEWVALDKILSAGGRTYSGKLGIYANEAWHVDALPGHWANGRGYTNA